jgi:8-oxo-dGTP diphosphatase
MSKTPVLPASLKQLLVKGNELFLPGISIDCVIFGFHENTLKLLLLDSAKSNKWTLPGGFVLKSEDINDAAYRVLLERTGLNDIYLKQFDVFGQPNRTDASVHKTTFEQYGSKIPKDHWMIQRFVSVGYFALIDYTNFSIQNDPINSVYDWKGIEQVKHLPIEHDHGAIIQKALESLRTQLAYLPIGKNLLPKKFTMPELQKLYETILSKPLDRRNFQRKMLGFGILNKLNETRKGGAHKAPFLYTFNDKKYQKALKEGLYGSW